LGYLGQRGNEDEKKANELGRRLRVPSWTPAENAGELGLDLRRAGKAKSLKYFRKGLHREVWLKKGI